MSNQKKRLKIIQKTSRAEKREFLERLMMLSLVIAFFPVSAWITIQIAESKEDHRKINPKQPASQEQVVYDVFPNSNVTSYDQIEVYDIKEIDSDELNSFEDYVFLKNVDVDMNIFEHSYVKDLIGDHHSKNYDNLILAIINN